MLSTPPPVYRRRSRPAKTTANVPPAQTVSVVSVRVLDSIAALWTFSAPVTVISEGQPCAQLRIQIGGVWQSAATSGNWEADEVPCDYDIPGNMEAGLAWEIVQTPANIDFGSAVLVLPQSGVVLPNDGVTRRTT